MLHNGLFITGTTTYTVGGNANAAKRRELIVTS